MRSKCATSLSQDAVMFPFFKAHGSLDFSDQSEQHKEIHHRLEEFDGLLTGAREDTSKFDANAAKEALLRAKTVLVSNPPNITVHAHRCGGSAP